MQYEGKSFYGFHQVDEMMGKKQSVTKFIGNHKEDLTEEDYTIISNKEYERLFGFKIPIKSKGILVSQKMVDKMTHKAPIKEGGSIAYLRQSTKERIAVNESKPNIETEKPKKKHAGGRPKLAPGEKGKTPVRKTKVEKLEERLDIPVVEEVIPQKVEATHTQNVTVTVDLNQLFQQFVNIQLQQFQAQQKQIEAQNKQISELTGMMKELISYQMEQPIAAPVDAEEKFPDFDTWKREINKAADKIVELNTTMYPTKNGIMREAYTTLTKEYGIVWDQSKKDFFEIYGRSPVNTMELCWFIEQNPIYRNLLLAKLSNMFDKASKETA